MVYMGKYVDFIIPECNTLEEIGERIIEHLTINRIKANKPSIFFLTGESGEGKNYTGLAIEDIITQYYDIELLDVIDTSIIYTPLEYSKKMNQILYSPKYKKLHVIMTDEARDLINARLWYTFINMAIADINAMHRGVKPLVPIIVSQFIKDIDPSIRRTIQFYGKCNRPIGKNTLLQLYRLWKDDRDLDNPRLRKRRVTGFMKTKEDYHKVILKEIMVKLPRKEIIKEYDKISFERKSLILKKKFEKLQQRLEKELGGGGDRINELVKHYTKNPELLKYITIRKGNNYHIKKEFKEIHDLLPSDVKEFENRLFEIISME